LPLSDAVPIFPALLGRCVPSSGVPATPQIRASFYAITDRGRTRDHNEDTFLAADLATPDAVRSTRHQSYDIGEQGVIFLVADGMGGAAAGEVASEMAAKSIHRYMLDVWRTDPEFTPDRFAERLKGAVELANVEIHNYAREHAELRGMGTTATVAGVWRDRVYLAQIGDSRAYLVRQGEARQLTRDQSLTQRLVEVGELTEEQAEASERRNIILQALGPDALVKVDLSWQSLQQQDVLIICSDGLSTVVRRDDISQVVRESPDIETVCRTLVDLANERGGPDNITVVVVRFDGDGLPAALPEPPGYHEMPSSDRPALQSTLAMPAVPPITTPTPIAAPVAPLPRGAPSGKVLLWLAIAMGILALALYLTA
jgi:PPM family protein phosphatase